MKIDSQRRRLLALGGTATLTNLAGCSGATPFVGKHSEDTRTYDADSVDAVTVNGQNGEVTARPTDGEQVRVETVKKAGSVFADLNDVSVETTVEGGELRIETRQTGDGSWLAGVPSVEVNVGLPSEVGLGELRTENGSVDVRDVETDATLVTENGSLEAHDVDGVVSAETENGSVTVRNVSGIGDLRTENGSVETDVPAIRGDTTVESQNGSVTAALSPDVDASVVATNDHGSVEFDVSNFETTTRSEHRVEGTLGDGGPKLRFATENGSVTVSEL
ncbi:DUF4097 family beta strand repeat-containing protein [Halorussus salinisoli]|uniref:DUF4097 family beta strand repeat-containing protein n=1 Tax=Halorussus salinisoli TaxID=2558242 RepID=UPI0010C1EAA2|nr:DUF4097 family beta strand repeat-containing protein [Halorussus salinisoli]